MLMTGRKAEPAGRSVTHQEGSAPGPQTGLMPILGMKSETQSEGIETGTAWLLRIPPYTCLCRLP